MKILHLLGISKWTGAAEPTFELCRGLAERGHDVHVAYSRPSDCCRLSLSRMEFVRSKQSSPRDGRPTLDQKAEEFNLNVRPELRLNGHSILRDNLHDIFILFRMLKKENFDIVHCHLSLPLYLSIIPNIGKYSRLFYTHHRPKALHGDLFHKWGVYKAVDHIIMYSPAIANSSSRKLGLSDDNISVLRGGIDLEPYLKFASTEDIRRQWDVPEDCLLIGMVARMQEKRDHETLLRAVAALDFSPEKVRCVLIGEGELRDSLISQCSKLGISEKVIFAGYHRGKGYIERLAAMDVFVYTSPGSDATCRAVIEAMAVGKPVVGVNRGALPLMVEPERNGYLFEAGNAGDLAGRIKNFIGNTSLICEMGKSSRIKAGSEFTIDAMVQSVEEAYLRELKR